MDSHYSDVIYVDFYKDQAIIHVGWLCSYNAKSVHYIKMYFTSCSVRMGDDFYFNLP